MNRRSLRTILVAGVAVAALAGCGEGSVSTVPAPTVTVTAAPQEVTPQVCLSALVDAQALINANADLVELTSTLEYASAWVTDDQDAQDIVAKVTAKRAEGFEAAARWHASEVACKALSPAGN